jgi:hypothetical protein
MRAVMLLEFSENSFTFDRLRTIKPIRMSGYRSNVIAWSLLNLKQRTSLHLSSWTLHFDRSCVPGDLSLS